MKGETKKKKRKAKCLTNEIRKSFLNKKNESKSQGKKSKTMIST